MIRELYRKVTELSNYCVLLTIERVTARDSNWQLCTWVPGSTSAER